MKDPANAYLLRWVGHWFIGGFFVMLAFGYFDWLPTLSYWEAWLVVFAASWIFTEPVTVVTPMSGFAHLFGGRWEKKG